MDKFRSVCSTVMMWICAGGKMLVLSFIVTEMDSLRDNITEYRRDEAPVGSDTNSGQRTGTQRGARNFCCVV